jgi:hypothetical protein
VYLKDDKEPNKSKSIYWNGTRGFDGAATPAQPAAATPAPAVPAAAPVAAVPKFSGSMQDLKSESWNNFKAALKKSATMTVGTILKTPDLLIKPTVENAKEAASGAAEKFNQFQKEGDLKYLSDKFDEIMSYPVFTKEDLPIITKALESGALNAEQIAKAKALLVAAGAKK